MIEYEFCMTADISKILAMVDLSSWAGHGLGARTRGTDLLFHSSAAGPCLTQPAFKRAAPKAISIFI